jgi:hypothetical protein
MDTRVRITDPTVAEAYTGAIVTYNTSDGPEYGRILRATPTQVALARLQLAVTGDFEPHPVSVCSRSRNAVTYSRDIRVVWTAAKMDPLLAAMAPTV